ncbi:MAG: hypothetical protein U5J99_01050 [Parvularculaceae bacterium]|nr:hypothetical protein [Parvularculaceae bacterium]
MLIPNVCEAIYLHPEERGPLPRVTKEPAPRRILRDAAFGGSSG